MHKATVADGSEQHGKTKVEAKHTGAQVAIGYRDCMTRPKRNGVKCPAVFLQRDLAFRAAVEVIEDHLRQTTPDQGPQVLDVHDAGRCDSRDA